MMNDKQRNRAGRRLAKILRHAPESIGLQLDAQGWAKVPALIKAMRAHGHPLTRTDLKWIVENNDKQRFAFSTDGRLIRANQGHSIEVDLGLQPLPPPDLLYHGTARSAVGPILARGLEPMRRQHVHLSADLETASAVGKRHGQLVLFVVDAAALHQTGHVFYRSDNGVWLTSAIPAEYLRLYLGA